jgi:predicted dehydrogenase
VKALLSRKQKRLLMLDKDIDAKTYGYQGRAPGKYPQTPLEELIRWRLWDRTGAGLMAELGSHQLDAATIFVSATRGDGKKVHPLTVTAVGGRHIFPNDRDVEDHVYCTYEFPGPEYYSDFDKLTVADPNKKIVVTYSSINGNGFGGYGEVVMGTKGTMIVDREQSLNLILDEDKSPTSVQASKESGPVVNTTESGGPQAARKLGGDGPISRGYTEEMEHWAWCIRNPAPENKPRCHPQVALADAVIALVSNYAIRQPQMEGRVEFKPEWFDVDHPANPEDDLKVKT